jgi:DNA-binding response OmpR family regulator
MRILLIDDNESIVKMLEKFLTIKGHHCTTSTDGRNALSLVTQEKFDIVILGLAMPKFTGYDVIDNLEKNGNIQKQNIIILTASVITTEQEKSLLKRGVKACLKKPVTPEVLLKTLDTVH